MCLQGCEPSHLQGGIIYRLKLNVLKTSLFTLINRPETCLKFQIFLIYIIKKTKNHKCDKIWQK